MVMAEASKSLTPVVLELGGKDPLVLLPGTDVDSIDQSAARAGWGASGQNCIGAERFFVHAPLVPRFLDRLSHVASVMRQGPPLQHDAGGSGVDIGAMCLPGEATHIQVRAASPLPPPVPPPIALPSPAISRPSPATPCASSLLTTP